MRHGILLNSCYFFVGFIGLVCITSADDTSSPRSSIRKIFREKIQPNGSLSDTQRGLTDRPLGSNEALRTLMIDLRILLVKDREEILVAPNYKFQTGSYFRIEIEPFSDQYFYVLNKDKEGTIVVLYPENESEHRLCRKEKVAKIPSDHTRFRFVEPSGSDHFRIIASQVKLNWRDEKSLWEAHGKNNNSEDFGADITPVRGESAAAFVDRVSEVGGRANERRTGVLPPTDDGEGGFVTGRIWSTTPPENATHVHEVVLTHE